MAYIYNLTDTWNAAGTVFTAVSMDVTDTASAAGSKIMSLKLNGTELFSVGKNGLVAINGTFGVSSDAQFATYISSGFDASTGPVAFEHGIGRSADGPTYMDFHAQSGVDYNARILRNSGANGDFEIINTGTGNVSLDGVMWVTSAGSVGIGTASPSSKLHVNSSGDVRFTLGNPSAALQFGVEATGPCFITNNVSQPFYFMTNNTERMRITAAGNVGVGTSAPNASAQFEVASTTRGFLPPRMTTAQRDAISSPVDGLVLYNSTTNKLQVRAASAWVDLH